MRSSSFYRFVQGLQLRFILLFMAKSECVLVRNPQAIAPPRHHSSSNTFDAKRLENRTPMRTRQSAR